MDQHIDEWVHLCHEFGHDIGVLSAQTMFLRILPETIRTEVHRRPELKRLELMKLIDWVRHQTLQERSEELAAQPIKPEYVRAVVREPRRVRKSQVQNEQPRQPPQQSDVQQLAALAPPRPAKPGQGAARRKVKPGSRRLVPLVRGFSCRFH